MAIEKVYKCDICQQTVPVQKMWLVRSFVSRAWGQGRKVKHLSTRRTRMDVCDACIQKYDFPITAFAKKGTDKCDSSSGAVQN